MFGLFKSLFGESVDYKTLVQKGALVIDVRSTGEYNSGHIEGSKNIPLDLLQLKLSELKKKGQTVITVCRSGNRSNAARSMLMSAGIEAYNGGAWHSLEKKLHHS